MRSLLMLTLSLMLISSTMAQDELWGEGDDIQYNCETVAVIAEIVEGQEFDLSEVSQLPFVREDEDADILSFGDYVTASILALLQFGDGSFDVGVLIDAATQACADQPSESPEISTDDRETLFNIITPQSVNLRSCASTTCDVVRQSRAGEIFEVVGVETPSDGDWYEIRVDDQTAFVAERVSTRGPDALINTDEAFLDPRTGCLIAFDIRRGSADLQFILTGDGRGDIVADIYRPNETNPLTVQGQLDKTFIDTGDPYIQQYYRFNMGWPLGIYNIELSYEGETSIVSWDMSERATYNIFIVCD